MKIHTDFTDSQDVFGLRESLYLLRTVRCETFGIVGVNTTCSDNIRVRLNDAEGVLEFVRLYQFCRAEDSSYPFLESSLNDFMAVTIELFPT